MKQFDLYINPDEDTKQGYPYFVDVQTELLNNLDSRVVIPIVPIKGTKAYPKNLCPIVKIKGSQFALLTHQITTVPNALLNDKQGSLLLNRNDIILGWDFLLTGI